MNLNEELACLDAEHAKKREELIRTAALLDALPEWAKVREPSVFFHSLYGKQVSLKWAWDFYSYGKDTWQPDLDFVLKLAEYLGPALPLVLVRDGCLSFRPAEHVNALPEEKKGRWDSETPVSPFLVKLSAFQHRTAEISWTVRLAGLACEVEVVLPRLDEFGKLDLIMRNKLGGRVVERCVFHPTERLTTLHRDEEPLAQMESPIRWARGSEDTPNDFTLYWVNLREDRPAQPADLARALLAK
jgi:hypothetical protein